MVAVDGFMKTLRSVPCIEKDSLVHFIFRGDARSVTVPSDANDWNPSEPSMKKVEGTDFWYVSQRFKADARIDYKFVIDGSFWILDPLNPRCVEGGYGDNSELRMPKYYSPTEIEYHGDITHGALEESDFRSDIFGNTHKVNIYTPFIYGRSGDKYPVVYFHDGSDFLSMGRAANVLNYLIARRRISPLIAVFVTPTDRNTEYAGFQMNSFDSFMADELIPFIDKNYRTKNNPSDRATIGVSNGGNISLLLGLHYPEIFGNIAALSSNIVSSVSNGYENSPRLSIKFYIDIGAYDIDLLIPVVHGFVSIIDAKGYPYVFRKYNEGHSWGNWRAHVGRALEYFFPYRSGAISKNRRRRLKIEQC